jgi:septum formation protein
LNLNTILGLNGRKLILASSSPRRKSLFQLAGFEFDVIDSNYDENNEVYTIPEIQALELAQKKAMKVAESISDGIVVGADTIVVLDNEIIGKPEDANHAKAMLKKLSGKTHTVYTGYAILEKPGLQYVNEYDKTKVTFRDLTDKEIEDYVNTGSPLDKAGAYGIQDQGAVFVTKVDGCFYNVMGFPISHFYVSLRDFLKKFNQN